MAAPRLPDDQISASAFRQRKYRADPANAEKGRIRSRVNYALKMGRLVRQPCFCGNLEVEAHHYAGYDLEHALDVAWLCKRHHEKIHKHRARPRRNQPIEQEGAA